LSTQTACSPKGWGKGLEVFGRISQTKAKDLV